MEEDDDDDDEMKVTKTSVQIENMELKRSTASQTKTQNTSLHALLYCGIYQICN